MSWLTEFVRPKIRTLLGARRRAGQSLASMPGLPADDLPPRPGGEPEGLPALRPPHARDRAGAPGLDLRRRRLHPHRAAEGAAGPAALPRHQALCRPAQGSARQDRAGRRDRRRARHASAATRPWSRSMDFDFMGGSMGAAVGEAIVAAARLAVLQQAPLIVFTASGGARMQEGAISLMQMPRTIDRHAAGQGSRPALHRRADRSRPPAASPPASPCWATSRSPSPAR